MSANDHRLRFDQSSKEKGSDETGNEDTPNNGFY